MLLKSQVTTKSLERKHVGHPALIISSVFLDNLFSSTTALLVWLVGVFPPRDCVWYVPGYVFIPRQTPPYSFPPNLRKPELFPRNAHNHWSLTEGSVHPELQLPREYQLAPTPPLLTPQHVPPQLLPLRTRAERSVLGDGAATASVRGQELFSPVRTCNIRGMLRFQQAPTQLLHTATTTYGNRTGYSAGNTQQSREEADCNQDHTVS